MQSTDLPQAPYCGMPPAPEQWLLAWNSDWRLWVALALLAAVGARVVSARRKAFALGWLALVLAFASPLCALTTALFAARSVHHVWLLTVAAPLLGAALPQLARRVPSGMALLLTLVVLGLWHVPLVYALAWQSHAWYAGLQLGLLLPSVVFWARIFALRQGSQGWAAAQVVGALAQMAALAGVMGLIGAVLTFAPTVLYPEHGLAPLAYGLLPLQDQQLGGLLMWVPGLLPLATIAGLVLHRAWRQAAHTGVATATVAAP